MNTYHVGDRVRVTGTLTDLAGAVTDPDTVTVKHRGPGGSVTAWVYGTDNEVVKSSAGVYYAEIDADAAGNWYYRIESTGVGKAASEGAFYVGPSEFD